MSNVVVTICATCGMVKDPETGRKPVNPSSEALAAEVGGLVADMGVEVRLERCLSMCDTPIAWALQGQGRHTTLLAPATTAAEMAETVRLYANTPVGEKMAKKDLPKAVKATLRGRILPL